MDGLEAIAGVDIRIPRTLAFVHIEGSTNGDNHSFTAGFAYAFGVR